MALQCSGFANNVVVQQLWQQHGNAAASKTAWWCSSFGNACHIQQDGGDGGHKGGGDAIKLPSYERDLTRKHNN